MISPHGDRLPEQNLYQDLNQMTEVENKFVSSERIKFKICAKLRSLVSSEFVLLICDFIAVRAILRPMVAKMDTRRT